MALRNAVIASVNLSVTKGTPKTPVPGGRLVRDRGFEGDAHAGPGPRQVSILELPSIRGMEERFGAPLGFGRFGENLVVDGGLAGSTIGDLLAVGDRAVLEVTAIGKECHSGCAIRQQTGDCIMPREGVFARVLIGGDVAPGDRVRTLRPTDDLTVVVLAGGRSTRFGADKRSADLDGRTLLDRALETAREASPNVLVSLAAGQPWTDHQAVRPVFDDLADAGPLAGIVSALGAATTSLVVFLPVDMPGVPSDLLKFLAARCDGPGLALRDATGPCPLPCCYRRSALPALQSALEEGLRSLHQAAARAGTTFLDVSEVADLGDSAGLLGNVNTPADLLRIRRPGATSPEP
jgi:molybdopterin-guanine dinucleotide biosynthesis protein A